jgi:hypothetical protein
MDASLPAGRKNAAGHRDEQRDRCGSVACPLDKLTLEFCKAWALEIILMVASYWSCQGFISVAPVLAYPPVSRDTMASP